MAEVTSSNIGCLQCDPSFPKEEVFGLTNQLRRAASSIAANIAEGCGRNTAADFVRFLHIAAGSASELEHHLLLAHELSFLDHSLYAILTEDITKVKKMLASFTQKLTADG